MSELKSVTITQLISEGDAGIILKEDGSYQVFNLHADLEADNLTPRQIEQANILLGFTMALKFPQIMEVLYKLSKDDRLTDAVMAQL